MWKVQDELGLDHNLITYFTEDGHQGWSTIVLHDFGEAGNICEDSEDAGKLSPVEALTQYAEPDRDACLRILERLNLAHYIDEVRLIVFMDNY